MHTPVKTPHIVLVVDPTLIGATNITEGLREDSIVIVNTTDTPAQIRKTLALGPKQKVLTLPATKISIDTIGRALPNAPMMGGFVKAVPIMSIDDLLVEIRASFEGKFPEKIIEGNLSAIRRGYEEAISDV